MINDDAYVLSNMYTMSGGCTTWPSTSHKTRGILSDFLRLREGARSQAPWKCDPQISWGQWAMTPTSWDIYYSYNLL